jgi:hypothetical protein
MTVALTGYEIISTFKSDFNFSQSFWFDHFRPGRRSRAGTLCDPYAINIGNTFTTNYSLFEWELVSVTQAATTSGTRPNSDLHNLAYSGATLETCDIIAIYVDADLPLRNTDLTVLITCSDVGGYTLMAKTSFSNTLLSGRYAPPLLGATPEILKTTNATGGQTSFVLNNL